MLQFILLAITYILYIYRNTRTYPDYKTLTHDLYLPLEWWGGGHFSAGSLQYSYSQGLSTYKSALIVLPALPNPGCDCEIACRWIVDACEGNDFWLPEFTSVFMSHKHQSDTSQWTMNFQYSKHIIIIDRKNIYFSYLHWSFEHAIAGKTQTCSQNFLQATGWNPHKKSQWNN